jgi:predicted flap endonuclease-1-like 5' DNA nuclease
MQFDLNTTLLIAGAAILLLILLVLMLRGRGRQRMRQESAERVERTADPYAVSKERPYMKSEAPSAAAELPPAPTPVAEPGTVVEVAPPVVLASEVAGIALPPHATDSADDLTRLKGVGPKLATLLNQEGITRYAQLAALDEQELAALDEKLGTFRGRLARDRVAEQARLLASGDREAYEAQFGKLGG